MLQKLTLVPALLVGVALTLAACGGGGGGGGESTPSANNLNLESSQISASAEVGSGEQSEITTPITPTEEKKEEEVVVPPFNMHGFWKYTYSISNAFTGNRLFRFRAVRISSSETCIKAFTDTTYESSAEESFTETVKLEDLGGQTYKMQINDPVGKEYIDHATITYISGTDQIVLSEYDSNGNSKRTSKLERSNPLFKCPVMAETSKYGS